MRRFVQMVAVLLALWAQLTHAQEAPDEQAEPTPEPEPASEAIPEMVVAQPAAAPASGPVPEMVVVGERANEAQRLQQSAEAVQVVDTTRAQQQSADLGEVLARVQGIGIRREGGLGSNVQFSLNGLTDDQVRFFMDGVPLEQAGFPFGIANVPVNLIERIEIYRGVVPVRFGADALGGTVNLVTPDVRQNYLSGSYQIGSFGTHRLTVDGRFHDAERGWVFGHTAFLDLAKNDYKVQADVAQKDGSPSRQTVRRFHDAYRAFGAKFEGGIVDQPWAKRLLISGYASSFDKELQHNLWMTGLPYGEATYRQDVYGATGRYEVKLAKRATLSALANYSFTTFGLRDMSPYLYDWTGARILKKPSFAEAGEINNAPTDQVLRQHSLFARLLGTWDVADEHTLRLSVRPAYITRQGNNRIQIEADAVDPETARNGLFTMVTGLEYQVNLLDDVLENILFVKDYVYRADVEQDVGAGAGLKSLHVNKHTQGVGDVLRLRATEWLDLKASYEYATRLPRADEALGNGGLLLPNVKLEPEVSHNANIGSRLAIKRSVIGKVVFDLNLFLREIDGMILLGNGGQTSMFSNVYSARSMGVENALAWSAPSGIASLDATFTAQDFRNTSSTGNYRTTEGQRVPNRPYSFGSWGGRLRFDDVIVKSDSIEPFYMGRYVHEFFLSWEDEGKRDSKLKVPTQVTHDIGVSWIFETDVARTTATLEIQNVTDARVYDNFGVQRPGRAFYAKLAGTFR